MQGGSPRMIVMMMQFRWRVCVDMLRRLPLSFPSWYFCLTVFFVMFWRYVLARRISKDSDWLLMLDESFKVLLTLKFEQEHVVLNYSCVMRYDVRRASDWPSLAVISHVIISQNAFELDNGWRSSLVDCGPHFPPCFGVFPVEGSPKQTHGRSVTTDL